MRVLCCAPGPWAPAVHAPVAGATTDQHAAEKSLSALVEFSAWAEVGSPPHHVSFKVIASLGW